MHKISCIYSPPQLTSWHMMSILAEVRTEQMNIIHYMKRHLSKPCGNVDTTVGWPTDKCELSKLLRWDCLLCVLQVKGHKGVQYKQ